MTEIVKIEGLADFQAALRRMDGQSQKMLRVVLNEAAEIVAEAAKKKAPEKTGALRNSIRATSQQRYAVVSGGSSRVPYFGFIDYGGTVGRARSSERYRFAKRKGLAGARAVREFIPTGRILYPAFLANEAEVRKAMEQGLTKLARDVGFTVENG